MAKLKTASQCAHKFSSTLYLTSALGGSGWSASPYGHFAPIKEPQYPFLGEVLWSPGPVLTGMERRSLVPTGLQTPVPYNPYRVITPTALSRHYEAEMAYIEIELRCASTQFP